MPLGTVAKVPAVAADRTSLSGEGTARDYMSPSVQNILGYSPSIFVEDFTKFLDILDDEGRTLIHRAFNGRRNACFPCDPGCRHVVPPVRYLPRLSTELMKTNEVSF